jgi:predicted O-linked N-acetylglucosamine transferase (SPINDLY family)
MRQRKSQGIMAEASLLAQLESASFSQIVATAEGIGASRGEPTVIALYRNWIAAHAGGEANLYAAWFNLGVEYAHGGQPHEAILAYRTVLALKPDFAPAAINLGLLLEQAGQPEAALQAWDRALQPDASRTALLNQRARLMEQRGALADAEATLRRSLLTDPRQPDAVQHWVHIRQKMCLWPALDETIPGLGRDELLSQCGPLAVLALTDRIAAQRAVAANWIARKTSPTPTRLSPVQGYRHDRIRLGYMSSDFCRHAMSYLIAELFERHDRSRFEVFGYCLSPEDGSDIRRRVIGAFDHFAPIAALSDADAAKRIRADEIDILIDLNGLTSGSRMQILRWRPAPVQATYLGFVGPVPLPELDFLLCDDYVVPPASVAAYQPQPLAIGQNYQVNDSKRVIGPPSTRAAAGLPEDAFLLCCFCNHYKITEEMFAAWMMILHRTPHAKLWLATDNSDSPANLRRRAETLGVEASRLVFTDRVDPAQYMARLALGDLFLDTFPYNAGTIASDAIRMGLPLITLAGEAFASRMAGRFLSAIGADRGIASGFDEYVETAVALATNADAYAAYRSLFTAERWSATIGDIARFTAEYEAALERIQAELMAREEQLAA